MLQLCLATWTFICSPKDEDMISLRPIRSSGRTGGALEEAGRAEQHIVTEAAPNELKHGRARKVTPNGHRQSVRQVSLAKNTSYVQSLLRAFGHTYTHTF